MIGDHHGRSAGRATLLIRAVDAILGTYRTDDYNTKIIEEFRANGGRVGGPWAGITLILIHHIGAKSGIERVSPLACSLQGDSRFAIWAANGGSPIHAN